MVAKTSSRLSWLSAFSVLLGLAVGGLATGLVDAYQPPAADRVSPDAESTSEWFRGWEMESRVATSQLILVARVSNISTLTMVHGGKVSTSYREYRFQPVRRLKGVFNRDELAMTSNDLGLDEGDGSQPPALGQGELRLLLLARTVEGFSCVSAAGGGRNTEQQLPRVASADDPLVTMTGLLVRVTETPSRQGRVALVAESLKDATPAVAVPLLKSFANRPLWVVQNPAAVQAVVRFVGSSSPAVRQMAVDVLDQILSIGMRHVSDQDLESCSAALQQLLETSRLETAVRAVALRAVGRLGKIGRRSAWAPRYLTRQLAEASTNAERYAAAAALGNVNAPDTAGAIETMLARLPLDESPTREDVLVKAVVDLAGPSAAALLLERAEKKYDAQLYSVVEIAYLGKLHHLAALPLLLRLARMAGPYRGVDEQWEGPAGVPGIDYLRWDAFSQQRWALAYALEQLGDRQAVPVLAEWLRSANPNFRQRALRSLEMLGGDDAVAAVRLRLKAEPDLALKLQMAKFLGANGVSDGQPFAIEHLADPGITAAAAEALGAIHDPKSGDELWEILQSSHDLRWNAGALAGLAAIHDGRVKDRLLHLLAEPRDPLVADALRAAATLGAPEALTALPPLVASRNDEVAVAALEAARQLANGSVEGGQTPHPASPELISAVAAVLNDPYANESVRIAAIETLGRIDGPRLATLLRTLADQSALEGTGLLNRIEHELRRLNAATPLAKR